MKTLWMFLKSFFSVKPPLEEPSEVETPPSRLRSIGDGFGEPRGSTTFDSTREFLEIAYSTRPKISLRRDVERYDLINDIPLGKLADEIQNDIDATKLRIKEPWEK